MSATHTHELRRTSFDENRIPMYQKHLHVCGTKNDCYEYLERIAKMCKCGVGLLLNNGGYEIVDLEEERVNKIKSAAPELLEALQEYVNNEERGIRYANKYGIPHQVSEKYRLAKAAIKKATDDNS